jgi:GxxExxY protein
MRENEVAHEVIGAALEVHKALGPGLLESAYQECLGHELELRGIYYQTEVVLPARYKGRQISPAYRADLLIGGCLLVELKSVEKLLPLHKAQLLTYLRLTECRLGLLINFNVTLLKSGITRVANGL